MLRHTTECIVLTQGVWFTFNWRYTFSSNMGQCENKVHASNNWHSLYSVPSPQFQMHQNYSKQSDVYTHTPPILSPILQTLNILAIHHLHPHSHIHCTPSLWMFLNLPIHHSSNSLTHFQDKKLIDCCWIVQKSETIIFIRVTFLKLCMHCFGVGTRFHVLITEHKIYNF
jgi:hypothetical protein